MTAIIGVTDGTTWAIGAERGLTDGSGVDLTALHPKVWRSGAALIGMAGGGAADWALKKRLDLDDPVEIAQYLLDQRLQTGWRVLVVRQDGLTVVDDNLDVATFAGGVGAIGHAEPFCLGAMAVLLATDQVLPVEDLIRMTLKLALQHVGNLRGPIDVISLTEADLEVATETPSD